MSCYPPVLLRPLQPCRANCIDEYMACGSAPYLNASEVHLLLPHIFATYLQPCTARDANPVDVACAS